MNTETLDKLYLEISQFTKAKTEREINLEKQQITNDERIISKLILGEESGALSKISSGLFQDFTNNTHSFEITDSNGKVFVVSIKVKEASIG